MSVRTFQPALSDLEQALVDVLRVGASGNAAGVRQLANRLARKVPTQVTDPNTFRAAIGEALAAAVALRTAKPTALREATAQAIPCDGDSALPLAMLSPEPATVRPSLPEEVSARVDALLRERLASDELRLAGLEPARTVLLSGPPGVGKTMTAEYIASSVGLPLLTIDLASVMSSYLGRTGQNLRAALDFGRSHAAVVFLDEFDALAKRRDDDSDIGELKRLVNVLLLELERWPSTSLLVAATNHRHLLDRAIERRFDVVIEVPLPGLDERRQILAEAWTPGDLDPKVIEALARFTDGASGSDLVSAVRAAARRSVVDGEASLVALVSEVSSRFEGSGSNRDQLVRLLHDALKISNREIAVLVGITHPTVSASLERTKAVKRGR